MAKEPKHGGKRPGAGRPKSDSDNVAVKMNRQVVRDARTVAVRREISLVEYLNSIVQPIVKRDLDKEMKKAGRDKGEVEG